jgi:hypothetical protein
MPKKKMYNADFDLKVDNQKLKSCFNFRNDLKVGAVGEAYVAAIFKDKNVTLEVKKDDWTTRSGNIAIEFESRGKPSGILTTKSDFWCQVVGHYFVLVFPVGFLREVYQKFHQNKKYVKEMGDRNTEGMPTSKAILIPWTDLLEMFKQYQPPQA